MRPSTSVSSASRTIRLVGLAAIVVIGLALGSACDGGTVGGSPGEESEHADVAEDGDGGASSSGGGGADGTASGPSGPGSTSGGVTSGSGDAGAATTGASTGGGGDTTATTTSSSGSTGSSSGPACGDGTCDAGETCDTCASDCGACAECAGAGDATTALDAEEMAFLDLLNAYRAENGRGPLSACTSLSRAAQGHSEWMRDEDEFSHTGTNGSSPSDRACDACFEQVCGSVGVAENIAAGNSGAAATFEQWRTSAGHNANMLGGYTQIGIGRATGGGTYGAYWTTKFAAVGEPSCN